MSQTTEEFVWVLEDVTKIVVMEESGTYKYSAVTKRTILTFTCNMKKEGRWDVGSSSA